MLNIDALILNLIMYGLIIFIIVLYPYIFKKLFNNYLFWIICGLIMVVYLIIGRFYQDWVNFVNTPIHDSDTSIITSKAWLMDLCPFVALTMSFFMIFDPSRKVINILSPFAVFGGIITITGGILFDNNASLTIQYIFLGNKGNEMYFMMHFLMTIFGIISLLSTPSFKWKHFIWCNVFAICYYFYVGMLVLAYDVTANASGLVPYDWTYGEYSGVGYILNLDYPAVMIVGFLLAYIGISAIVFINYWFKKIKKYYVSNEHNTYWNWYSIN